LETEGLGLKEVGKCGFVLVAGGLGERLGYGDIKIGLPTELATETTYIQFYIETILAFQSRYAEGKKLPLCIMTSGDTNEKTVALLSKNNYFGMDKDQITIVQQGKGVPALYDNDAHIALVSDDPYDIQMKPHGHGDIHALLHSHGVAKSWLEQGMKWTVFFQDTNGLAFHTLALALGVSSKLGLVMNSITCPRKAKQAIGAITKLTKGDQERTINVEYNQLDPLLRATGHDDGDVNDETGFSPFPGNINQLLFNLESYVSVLERTKGVMPEFVNPKYKDAEKTVFKKPTRLECMMQDFPTVLEGADAAKVGFTSLASELCFSPVKNATADGVALQAKGTHPGVAATGEADQSNAVCEILRSIGCDVQAGSKVTFSGIEFGSGPDCVLKPSFAACASEFKKKFPNPSAIKISGRSSLVLSGDGLVVESLNLDGALVVECEAGASGVIRDLSVTNKGWVKVADEASDNEVIRMRGYRMSKLETEKIVFKADGSIEGNYPPKKAESAAREQVLDLSKPSSGEKADGDTLCGGCVIS
jgi:UDP-sugar pyrophosphorylase